MTEEPLPTQRLKHQIRTQAEANRRAKPDKDEASELIWERLAALPEYVAAETVMGYVHFRSEVRTRGFLATALAAGKRVVVPYCLADHLELFLLECMDELAPGTWGIPEPKVELRSLADKRVDAGRLDLVVVPGVAFDRRGHRLGHGKGYYDKLLVHVRPGAPLVGLAFECQLFPKIPTRPHDVPMDRVITEKAVYRGRGR
ncbi:MAG TPA: 5-formyltetrahydrofolate cyclo-ligase [Thermoguttaceae bacterium]|nr:5-formyltetrahydrofolate cyclo-ligase [Thermoguttaceae bacterium]